MSKDTPKKSQKIDPVIEAAKKHLDKLDKKYSSNEHAQIEIPTKKKKEQFLINPEEVETIVDKKNVSSKSIYYLILLPLTIAFLFFLLFSCTLSVTTLHTQGRADDVIDEQQESSPNISPDIRIPITGK